MTKTQYALLIGGPVETAGCYLTHNGNYTGFKATEFVGSAIKFNSKSAAYKYRRRIEYVLTDSVTLKVQPVTVGS